MSFNFKFHKTEKKQKQRKKGKFQSSKLHAVGLGMSKAGFETPMAVGICGAKEQKGKAGMGSRLTSFRKQTVGAEDIQQVETMERKFLVEPRSTGKGAWP